jgi:hypothetical protein
VLAIDRQKHYRDAFTDKTMRLYLPVNDRDEVVEHTNGEWLKCWTWTDVEGEVPVALSSTAVGISHALLWAPREDARLTPDGVVIVMAPLPRSVAFNSLSKLDQWSRHLERSPEFDIEYRVETKPIFVVNDPEENPRN